MINIFKYLNIYGKNFPCMKIVWLAFFSKKSILYLISNDMETEW